MTATSTNGLVWVEHVAATRLYSSSLELWGLATYRSQCPKPQVHFSKKEGSPGNSSLWDIELCKVVNIF